MPNPPLPNKPRGLSQRRRADRVMLVRLCRAGFVALLFAVVYLSWKPYPSIVEVRLMPTAIGVWFDQHDFSKNLIGYGIFGLTGFIAWSKPTSVQGAPQSSVAMRSLKLFACFWALVLVLELGQLALPHRTCDWDDMLAGWMGLTLAWAIFQAVRFAFAGRNTR